MSKKRSYTFLLSKYLKTILKFGPKIFKFKHIHYFLEAFRRAGGLCGFHKGDLITSYLLHVGASFICPHGGQISAVTTNNRVLVSKQPVVTQADSFLIAGCVFTLPGGVLHPCVLAKWLVPSTRILVTGKPAILQNSTGICQSGDQTPQGPPNVILTQIRVKGI